MSTPAVIDYASPASRASLRLPARSEIRWEFDPAAGELRVVQTLAGRGEALAALGLAAFTFIVMTVQVYAMTAKLHRHLGDIALLGTFMAAEAVVAAFVINNTWRTTALTVTAEEMRLEMASPFAAGQQFRFAGEQVASVSVVDREPRPGEAVVPELEIRMWSIPPLRLFAGHPQETLLRLTAAIARVQPPPPAPPAPIPSALSPSPGTPR